MTEFFPRKDNRKMQKPTDNKQTWMNSALNKGTVIGNAQIGPASSKTVIGNAVIGGMAACCGGDVDTVAGGLAPADMIGNASVATGVVGNVVIESPNWKKK